MAQRIVGFTVTVPAGTPTGAPASTPLAVPVGQVVRVEVDVPPGPAGNVGFALAYAGQQMLPENAGAWVIANNRTIDWTVEDYPTGGQWSVIAYNTGAYPHTLGVRFHLVLTEPAPTPAAPSDVPISGQLISASPAAGPVAVDLATAELPAELAPAVDELAAGVPVGLAPVSDTVTP